MWICCFPVATHLQTTQVSLCMLQFTMTVFYESVFGFHAIVSDHSCVQTYLCVFSSGLWSYFRIRLLNKASCNCKDSNKTQVCTKVFALLVELHNLFVLSFHRNTCKWRFPWSEVSTIKDGVDVNPSETVSSWSVSHCCPLLDSNFNWRLQWETDAD